MVRNVIAEIQWRNAAAQMMIIVTGVLVALGAQALWNMHQDRGREAEYLSQLRLDLVRTIAVTDSGIAEERVDQTHLRKMRQALHSIGAEPPADSILLWVAHHLVGSKFVMGTVDALLQTGDVHLISDDSIRVGIIEYAAAMASEARSLERVGSAYFERSANVRRSVEAYAKFTPVSWQDTTLYRPTFIDLAAMKKDPSARAAYTDVYASISNTISSLKDARDASAELLELMDRRRLH